MSNAIAQFPNLVALSVQVACVVVAAAAIGLLLRVSRPGIRYGFWRLVLVVCLILPWMQTPHPAAATTAGTVAVSTAVAVNEPGSAVSPQHAEDWSFLAMAIIAGGVTIRLAWLIVGYARLRRLRGAGEGAQLPECDRLQVLLGTRAEVRHADAVRHPVTFGLWRPVVLLPATLRNRAPETRDLILSHELVHVRRRDWCWVVVEELLRSAFWFNPAMWWLISQVQHTREEVVDATVVAFSGRRREYLDALLAFSDEVPLAPASAFSRRRHLFRRIMLLSTEDVMSARRIVFSAFMMAVTVLAVSAVAVRAFPMRSSETPGVSQPSATMASLVQPPGPIEQSARQVTTDNPIPKRVSGDEPVFPSIADGSDMSVTVMLRVTIDQVGNVAELRLGRFTFRRGGMSASVDGGGFNQFVAKAQLKDAPGGSVMTAESMRSIFEAFIETAADAVARWQYEAPREGPLMFATTAYFTDGRASTANTEATRRTVVNSEGALRVGANIKPPAKIRDVRPVYPPEALEARVQGVVIAEVRIEGDGRVSDAKILRSIPMLDQAALDAIHQWEFMPTLLNGAPVPMIMTVTVQFTLAP